MKSCNKLIQNICVILLCFFSFKATSSVFFFFFSISWRAFWSRWDGSVFCLLRLSAERQQWRRGIDL